MYHMYNKNVYNIFVYYVVWINGNVKSVTSILWIFLNIIKFNFPGNDNFREII